MANQIPEGLISHQTQFSSIIDAMEKGKPEEQILWAVNANEHKVTFELLEEEVNRLADNFFEENQNSFTTNCNEYSESINRIKNTMILIETNENAAKQLIEISKKIQIIYKNINGINSESIKELKENLTVITLHENLNIGNRIAINLLNEELSNLDKLEFENTTQSQNENYDVGCLKDRKNLCFSKILDNSINTPLIDYFYEVIEIYKDANKYNLNKTHYTKPENKELVLSILQETKECLQKIISEQKKTELPIELPLIQQLQSLLEQEVPNADAINEAYKKLEANDKNLVLEELSTFLQIAKTIKRSLPVTLLGQLFLTWPGTLEQKRDALLKISPTSESNIEAESLANFMQELFVETVGIEETCRVVGIPLEVVFDAGFGNEIFVVGCGGKAMNTQGEWLDLGNWNTPIKLACTESVKWITKLSHTANECKIKFLLNGKYWQDGEDITIFPGQENVKIEKINFNFDKHFEKK